MNFISTNIIWFKVNVKLILKCYSRLEFKWLMISMKNNIQKNSSIKWRILCCQCNERRQVEIIVKLLPLYTFVYPDPRSCMNAQNIGKVLQCVNILFFDNEIWVLIQTTYCMQLVTMVSFHFARSVFNVIVSGRHRLRVIWLPRNENLIVRTTLKQQLICNLCSSFFGQYF